MGTDLVGVPRPPLAHHFLKEAVLRQTCLLRENGGHGGHGGHAVSDAPGVFIGAEAYNSRRTRAEQQRVYASLEWLFARGQALQRDGYRCQRCARAWRLEVHHKHSLRDGGAAFDLDNLMTLCHRCHQGEHPE